MKIENEPVKHAIISFGTFYPNYERLLKNPNMETSIDSKGKEVPLGSPPKKTNGMVFWTMTTKKDDPGGSNVYFVKVDDIVLKNRFELDFSNHTDGQGIGPQGINIKNQTAMDLLDDIIEENPDKKEELEKLKENYAGRD